MEQTAKKSRYKGNLPYSNTEKNIFFGRKTEADKLFKKIYLEKITVLHSSPKNGKTSLVNAGLIPQFEKNDNYLVYKLNLLSAEKSQNITNQVFTAIKSKVPKLSYLDKIISHDEKTLWTEFKKIQSQSKTETTHLIIIDDFQNFLEFSETHKKDFAEQIYELLFSQIPDKYREKINSQIAENPDLLSAEGFQKLYENQKIKLLLVSNSQNLEELDFLKNQISSISKNIFELDKLTQEQAIQAITKPANYTPKYSSQNNFLTPAYNFSPEAIEKISSTFFAKNKEIQPCEIQIIGQYFEKIVFDKKIETIKPEHIAEISIIFQKKLKKIISQIETEEQQKNILDFIIEELFFEQEKKLLYSLENLAIKKYNISAENIEKLISENLLKRKKIDGENFLKIQNQNYIEAIYKHKKHRRKKQAMSEELEIQREKFKKEAEAQKKRNRKLITIFSSLIVFLSFLTIIVLLANKNTKNKAKIETISKSNAYSVVAFREMQQDPTLGFRISEIAFNTDPENSAAYSALIQSFYKTNVFYNKIGNINFNFSTANFSKNGEKILFIENKRSENFFNITVSDRYGKKITEIPHKFEISSAYFSNDSKYIITASWDSIARIYSSDGELIREINNHKAILWNARFSNDNQKIITAGSDKKLIVWSFAGDKIQELIGHEADVKFADFSPNDSLIVSAAADNTIKIWNTKGEIVSEYVEFYETSQQNTQIETVFFSSDNQRVIACLNEYMYTQSKVIVLNTDAKVQTTFRTPYILTSYANFFPSGENFIVADNKNKALVVDNKGNIVYELIGHNAKIISAFVSKDEKTITTVSEDKSLREWFLKDENQIISETENLNFAKFSQIGVYIIRANDTKITVAGMLENEVVSFDKHTDFVNFTQISPSGEQFISCGDDNTAFVWNFEGEIICKMEHADRINTATFAPNGEYYLTASSDKSAILWDKTGKELVKIKNDETINSAFFSPNSKNILIASNDNSAKLFDLKGNLLQTFTGHKGKVTSAVFSPNGKRIITTSQDATAKLWTIDGKNIVTFRGYKNQVNSATFSPDSKYVATSSDDGTARIWDTNGNEIIALQHSGKVLSASYSPNGNYILTVYFDENFNKRTKLWLVSASEILNHIDGIKQYGNVWQLDSLTQKRLML